MNSGKELLAGVPDGKHTIIAPDGPFTTLPFELLIAPGPGGDADQMLGCFVCSCRTFGRTHSTDRHGGRFRPGARNWLHTAPHRYRARIVWGGGNERFQTLAAAADENPVRSAWIFFPDGGRKSISAAKLASTPSFPARWRGSVAVAFSALTPWWTRTIRIVPAS